MKKVLSITTLFLVWSAISAYAMTGLEFLSLNNDSSAKYRLLNPIVINYVSQGYKNVPSWATLSSDIEELIRKNGYARKDVEEIALEAAIARGMTK